MFHKMQCPFRSIKHCQILLMLLATHLLPREGASYIFLIFKKFQTIIAVEGMEAEGRSELGIN